MKSFLKSIGLVVLSLQLLACSQQQTIVATTSPEPVISETMIPKNIILMIADGTGISQISATQFYGDQISNYERFENIGLIKTSSSSDLVTDSAAGATAFSAGIKTYNGAIAVNDKYASVPTILEQLSDRGYATGVIATSTITHATPASFYAHVTSRKFEEDIALALSNSAVDFFAGGGLKFFNNREDKVDLIAAMSDKGFSINTENLNANTSAQKLGFLLADSGMPKMTEDRGDFLEKASQLGIKHLSQDEDGYFLMIEGSQIDWGGHANDADYLIQEMNDFDKTLGFVLDYAKQNGETLVIVTADHETGGFTLAGKDGDYNTITPSFSTGNHSATMVPVFAYGPGSDSFRGVYENTEIYHKMKQLLKL